MDVSIVIVSFNTCRILDECLDSIRRETACSHEVIVVDNGSRDDSCRMVREKNPDVILIENNRNAGFAAANNQGFAIARGRYFLMLNSDTVIVDGAIDRLVAFMESRPQTGICGPRNIGGDGEMQYNCDHFPGIWSAFCYYSGLDSLFPRSKIFNRCGMGYWDYGEVRDVDRIVGCSLLIRAELYRELGGLDENYFMYFEETDFCYRANRRGVRTTFTPCATVVHYGGESSKAASAGLVVGKTVSSYFQASQYHFYRKNYGVFSLFAIRLLHLVYGLFLLGRNTLRIDRGKRQLAFDYGAFMVRSALAGR